LAVSCVEALFLTPAELRELTGLPRKSAISRGLARHAYPPEMGAGRERGGQSTAVPVMLRQLHRK
jgi:Domain of unknown function (DUF4224)